MELHPPSTQALQVLLSCSILLINGATFSVGSFTLPVEEASRPASALAGVWPASMEYVHLFSAPVMVIGGLVLSAVESRKRTFCARVLSFISSFAFALFGLSAVGVACSAAWIVQVGVAFLAIPLGMYTVLVADHTFCWMPLHPGLAMALAGVSFNFGIIVSVWMFDILLHYLPVVHAIATSAGIMFVGTFLPTLFLRYPATHSGGEQQVQAVVEGNSEEPLLQTGWVFPKLSPIDALKLPSFWLFMFCAMSAGASYALTPYFFKLGSLFGQRPAAVNLAFQISSFVALIVCLIISVVTERFRTGQGAFSSGSRNVLSMLISLQLLTSVYLLHVTKTQFFEFAVASGVFKMIVLTHNLCVALLAVEMFGHENVALVYGVGGGLSIGTGEAISVKLMAALDNGQGPNSVEIVRRFYVEVAVWSIFAILAIVLIRRNKLRTVQSSYEKRDIECVVGERH